MNWSVGVFGGEQLTANGVTLVNGWGWLALDLSKLWETQWFWDNRVAPGVSGSLPFVAAEDELKVSLDFWIVGTHFFDGTPYDDPKKGFWRNWQYLAENVWNGQVVGSTYQPPDPEESPINITTQFSAPSISERYPTDWKGTLQVIVSGGAVRPVGS